MTALGALTTDRPDTIAAVTWLIGAGNTVAAMVLLTAWWRASMQSGETEQYVWIDVAAAALIAGGCANAAALIRLRRAIGLSRVRIARAAVAATAAATAHMSLPKSSSGPAAVDEPFVTVTGMRRHRPSCPLVLGKTAASADGVGLLACGVCES